MAAAVAGASVAYAQGFGRQKVTGSRAPLVLVARNPSGLERPPLPEHALSIAARAPAAKLATNTTQATLRDLFKLPAAKKERSVGVAQVTSAILWFQGSSGVCSKERSAMYNAAQKRAAVFVRSHPMTELVQLVDAHLLQLNARQDPVPPEAWRHLLGSETQGVTASSHSPAVLLTLQDACSLWLFPAFSRHDVEQAVQHFRGGTVNEIRALAAACVRSHVPRRIRFLCSMAVAQAKTHSQPVLPQGFPEIIGPQAEATADETAFSHDACKVRTALHILKLCRPDSDFAEICSLLSACGTPGMEHPHGVGRRVAAELEALIAARELQQTAHLLREAPFWLLVTDGAHKKNMRSAPDIVRVAVVDMRTGTLVFRHIGLVVPHSDAFLNPGTRAFVKRPLSAENIGDRIRKEVEALKTGESVNTVLTRCIGLATDGANVMAGQHGGLAAVMRTLGAHHVCHYVDVAHQTETIYRHAHKVVPYHKKFMRMIRSLNSTMGCLPVRQ